MNGKHSGLSYSMFIDDYNMPIENKQLKYKVRRQVQPQTIYHWIDDESVTRCCQCGTPFSLFTRKHHCRNCGRIFCHTCSSQKMHLKVKKRTENGLLSYFTSTTKQRVCIKCYKTLKSLEEIETLIEVFKLNIFLDIKDYFTIANVCKGWSKLSLRYFSKFREIQYKLIYDFYDKEEINIIHSNRHYFFGHDIWKIHLIKTTKWKHFTKKEKNQIIKIILSPLQKCNCWNLMCSRKCKNFFSIEDILLCLEGRSKIDDNIVHIMLNSLKNIPISELSCYITVFLEHCSNYSSVNLENSPIIRFLIKYVSKSEEFAYILLWELNYFKCDERTIYNKIEKIMLKNINIGLKKRIKQQKNLVQYLTKSFKKKYTKSLFMDINNYLQENPIYKKKIPVITNPSLYCDKIDVRKIKMKSSNSKPLIMPCIVRNKQGKQIKYEILYKYDDLRKESIIMNAIILMDKIFKREEKIDLNIIRYHILPVNCKEGFIEIIPNAITLYELKKKGFSIQNYIIENNSKRSMEQIRMRIVNSCAAYCVITYVLGIGDRHLENIMLTKSGLLFHIDYGFILGNEPKFLAPEIRITPDMVDAMGGIDSKYYNIFQNTCTKFYNCLRRHVNLFIVILSMLYKIKPTIENNKFTKKFVKEQIIKRFLPNENYEEAKLKFKTHVENSHKSNYNSSFFIDFFHRSHSDKSIFKSVDNIIEEDSKLDNSSDSAFGNSSILDLFWKSS